MIGSVESYTKNGKSLLPDPTSRSRGAGKSIRQSGESVWESGNHNRQPPGRSKIEYGYTKEAVFFAGGW